MICQLIKVLARQAQRQGGWPLCLWLVFSSSLGAAEEWQSGAGYRSRPLNRASEGKTGFTALNPAGTGIHFTNRLDSSRFLTNQIYLNGSGVALGDIDGDGL